MEDSQMWRNSNRNNSETDSYFLFVIQPIGEKNTAAKISQADADNSLTSFILPTISAAF
jgi:hypothetical protein